MADLPHVQCLLYVSFSNFQKFTIPTSALTISHNLASTLGERILQFLCEKISDLNNLFFLETIPPLLLLSQHLLCYVHLGSYFFYNIVRGPKRYAVLQTLPNQYSLHYLTPIPLQQRPIYPWVYNYLLHLLITFWDSCTYKLRYLCTPIVCNLSSFRLVCLLIPLMEVIDTFPH